MADDNSPTCHFPLPEDGEGVHLHDLSPGDRFTLPLSGKVGTLKRLARGHAIVDYDSGKTVSFYKYEDTPEEELITFERPRRDLAISPCTVVERLEAKDD